MKYSINTLLVLLVVLIISGCVSDSNPPSPPTDQELIQTFNDNKQIFIQLQAKLFKDNYSEISFDPEWSNPASIPLEVKKQYYNLLKQVNVVQMRKIGKDTVVFAVWNTGNVSGGDSKGYIFKPGPDWPREEKESLDNISSTGKDFFYKRNIADGWYLYYDHFI